MERMFLVLLFVLATTLQTIAAAKDESDLTSVDDFSRCRKIKIKKLHIDDEVCVKIGFIKSEIGIEISITWDGKAIFKTKISVKEPPPICLNAPVVKGIKVCLKLTDVSFEPHHHGACLALEIKAIVIHKTFKLGCIYKEIEEANRKTPLQILQAVRALVNTDIIKETGNEKVDWLKDSDESANDKNTENVLDFFTRDTKEQVEAEGKISKECSCPRPTQCLCCKNFALSPRLQTKVCGKVVGTQEGKGLWVSLAMDGVKYFRVHTTVSRRFKFACTKVEHHDTKSVMCLHIEKVVQTAKGIDLCLSAASHVKSSKRLVSLGCMTVRNEEDGGKPSDDLVKFEPVFKRVLHEY